MKPLHSLGRQAQRPRENFERHLAVERNLEGFIDDAHAAAAELAYDLEVSKASHVVRLPGRSHSMILPKAFLRVNQFSDFDPEMAGWRSFQLVVKMANKTVIPFRIVKPTNCSAEVLN